MVKHDAGNDGVTRVYFTATERIVGGVIITLVTAMMIGYMQWIGNQIADLTTSNQETNLALTRVAAILDERTRLLERFDERLIRIEDRLNKSLDHP